jgi:uncharacterized membrane protein
MSRSRQEEKELRRQARVEREVETRRARNSGLGKFFATFGVAAIAINVIFIAITLIVVLVILKAFGVF